MTQQQQQQRLTILCEVQRMLSAMRRSSGLANKSSDSFYLSILQQFEFLRKSALHCVDTKAISRCQLLLPFLNVIRDEKTSGPLTSEALSSVYALLIADSGIFDSCSPNAAVALSDLIEAVVQCRFQATDPSQDQITLVRIIQVLQLCVTHCGHIASDDLAWLVVESCYGLSFTGPTSFQTTALFRSVAVHSLNCIIDSIFSKCQHNTQSKITTSFGLPVAVKLLGFLCRKLRERSKELHTHEDETSLHFALIVSAVRSLGDSILGFPSLMHLVKDDVCCLVLSHSRLQSISSVNTTLYALQILRILWFNVRSQLKIQMEALFNGVFINCMRWIISFFNSSALYVKTTNSSSQVLRSKSLEILQCLVDIVAEPSTVVDLYINYDCDKQRSNITEDIISLLSAAVQASSVSNEPSSDSSEESRFILGVQRLSLQGLGSILKSYYDRSELLHVLSKSEIFKEGKIEQECSRNGVSWDVADLARRYNEKKDVRSGIEQFNKSPRKGLKLLEEKNIIPRPLNPHSVAVFLRSLPSGLEKAAVGEYIGAAGKNPGEGQNVAETIDFHAEVLKEFVGLFNFTGQTFLDSLRMFLASFRLPGEAQQIDRILQAFSIAAYTQCHDCCQMASVDVAFLLSFSIIILNTDLHNPNIRPEKKMSLEDFRKNNLNYGLDVSKGENLPIELLDTIYYSVLNQEIQTRDDGASGEVTEDRWRDIMRQIDANPASSSLILISSSSVPFTDYDQFVFEKIYKTIIEAFASVFTYSGYDGKEYIDMAEDLQLACNSFVMCASVACNLNLCAAFDQVVYCLAKQTKLEDSRLTFAEFCANQQAQAASVAFFTLVNRYMSSIAQSWKTVIKCLFKLHEFKVLPIAVLRENGQDFLTSDERMIFISKCNAVLPVKNKTDDDRDSESFFYSIASYFSRDDTNDENAPPQLISSNEASPKNLQDADSHLESTFSSRQERHSIRTCLKTCHLESFVADTKFISNQSLENLLSILVEKIEVTLLPQNEDSVGASGLVFSEHLLTEIALKNRFRIIKFWSLIHRHYATILSQLPYFFLHQNPGSENSKVASIDLHTCVLLLEKITVGMLRLTIRLISKDSQKELFGSIKLLADMDDELLSFVLPQLASGVYRLVSEHIMHIDAQDAWIVLLKLIHRSSLHETSARYGIDTVSVMIERGKDHALPSNEICVDACFYFAFSHLGTVAQSVASLSLLYTFESKVLSIELLKLTDSKTDPEGLIRSNSSLRLWVRILGGLVYCCRDSRSYVRHAALVFLQRFLLTSAIHPEQDHLWELVFAEVVLPLALDISHSYSSQKRDRELVDSSLFRMNLQYYVKSFNLRNGKQEEIDTAFFKEPVGSSSILLCMELLSKLFLHHLKYLQKHPAFHHVWMQIINIYRALFSIENSAISEEINEQLKNIICVMHSEGVFKLPEAPVWKNALNDFCTFLSEESLSDEKMPLDCALQNLEWESILGIDYSTAEIGKQLIARNYGVLDKTVFILDCSTLLGLYLSFNLLKLGVKVRAGILNLQPEASHIVSSYLKRCSSLFGVDAFEIVDIDESIPKSLDLILVNVDTVFLNAKGRENALDIMQQVIYTCRRGKHVKRIILTSSVHAIIEDIKEPKTLTAEEWVDIELKPFSSDFSDITGDSLIERKVWLAVSSKDLEIPPLPLIVVNTGEMIGDQVITGMTPNFITRCLEAEDEKDLLSIFPVVDVRDAVLAHVTVMESGSSERIICCESILSGKELLNVKRGVMKNLQSSLLHVQYEDETPLKEFNTSEHGTDKVTNILHASHKLENYLGLTLRPTLNSISSMIMELRDNILEK